MPEPENICPKGTKTQNIFIILSSPALLNIEKPGSIFNNKNHRIFMVSEI